MSKIAALLADDVVAEAATDHLAKLKIDNLTWDLINESDNFDRVIPAVAWPAGATGQVATTGAPVGLVAQGRLPEGEVLRDEGASGNTADYFAQSIARGATAIIVDVPHEYRDQVASTLQHVGATQISWE